MRKSTLPMFALCMCFPADPVSGIAVPVIPHQDTIPLMVVNLFGGVWLLDQWDQWDMVFALPTATVAFSAALSEQQYRPLALIVFSVVTLGVNLLRTVTSHGPLDAVNVVHFTKYVTYFLVHIAVANLAMICVVESGELAFDRSRMPEMLWTVGIGLAATAALPAKETSRAFHVINFCHKFATVFTVMASAAMLARGIAWTDQPAPVHNSLVLSGLVGMGMMLSF